MILVIVYGVNANIKEATSDRSQESKNLKAVKQ